MNLLNKYKILIPQNTRSALELCSKAADFAGLKIYLIGGVVRDLILDMQSFDIDITVVGDATEFAKLLEREYQNICLVKQLHDDFKTAKVIFSIDEDNIEIDLASTRIETYIQPAALPSLEKYACSLQDDVKRRDFTINSMALSLNKEDFCELVDYEGGFDDLQNKFIRVLHSDSYVDDPTRMIRSIKFRSRFGCQLEEETLQQQINVIESSRFDDLRGERVKSEFKQTFNLNQSECYEYFINEGIYRLISKDIDVDELPNSHQVYDLVLKYENAIAPGNIWLVYLAIFLENHTIQEVSEIASDMNMSYVETNILLGYKRLQEKYAYLEHNLCRFEIYEFFEKYEKESIIAFLAICNSSIESEKIVLYLNDLQYISICTSGSCIRRFGLKPGPEYSKILRELLQAKVNQIIQTEEQEAKLLSDLVKPLLSD